MKTLKRVVLVILLVVLFFVALVTIMGKINTKKYSMYREKNPISNVTDIKNYDKKIDGMQVKVVKDKSVNGIHLIPDNIKHPGVVITYGGSEGSPNYKQAVEIAKQGYETYALFFFGMTDQKKSLLKVPLDSFKQTLDYVNNNSKNPKPLTILGGSKGAEYALLLAGKYPEINNLILFAPASYVTQGLDNSCEGSSWTYDGKELPYLKFKDSGMSAGFGLFKSMLFKEPIVYKKVYEGIFKNSKEDDKKKAYINIKNYTANILLFAGDDDMMWQSAEMATMLKEENPNKVDLHIYKDAGHIFGLHGYLSNDAGTIAIGGEKEASIKAFQSSEKVLFEKLSQWHK